MTLHFMHVHCVIDNQANAQGDSDILKFLLSKSSPSLASLYQNPIYYPTSQRIGISLFVMSELPLGLNTMVIIPKIECQKRVRIT